MPKETISFRLEANQRKALDHLARAFDRDRSYLIGEAIGAYLEVQRWHIEQIEEGLRQAKTGEFASDDEVAAVFSRS